MEQSIKWDKFSQNTLNQYIELEDQSIDWTSIFSKTKWKIDWRWEANQLVVGKITTSPKIVVSSNWLAQDQLIGSCYFPKNSLWSFHFPTCINFVSFLNRHNTQTTIYIWHGSSITCIHSTIFSTSWNI